MADNKSASNLKNSSPEPKEVIVEVREAEEPIKLPELFLVDGAMQVNPMGPAGGFVLDGARHDVSIFGFKEKQHGAIDWGDADDRSSQIFIAKDCKAAESKRGLMAGCTTHPVVMCKTCFQLHLAKFTDFVEAAYIV